MTLPAPVRAPRRRARTLLGAAVAASVLLVSPFALAAPASAHDELVATDPADGSSLPEAPDAVTLTFGEEVVELGTAVVVVDSAGVKLADGDLVVDGAVITRPIKAPTAAGEVTVSYRVVSADGHPVTGRFSFTVEAVAPSASPSESESESETASEPASATPSASEPSASATSEPAASPSTTPVSSEQSGSALPWVLGGLAVLALAGAAVAAARGRRAGSGS